MPIDSYKEKIDIMHEYLQIFRKLAKWSSAELGQEIGVSRSTIVNFERNVPNIRMSTAQYIALATVLEARAMDLSKNKKDTSLKEALDLVLYNKEYENSKINIKTILAGIAATAAVAPVAVSPFSLIPSTIIGNIIGCITGGVMGSIINHINIASDHSEPFPDQTPEDDTAANEDE